jgi:hypothetical protein
VTLHQILNIYLRLSHNDGNDEPEALYLTLSSRPAVHSELADLETAANEGKGLSHVHPWSEFEDGEDHEEPQVAEHPIEEPSGDRDGHDLSFHKAEERSQEQVVSSVDVESEVHDAINNDAPDAPNKVIHESASGEHDAPAESETGAAETQQADETDQADEYADENTHDYQEQYEEQYDSEAPKRESTSTVVPASDQVEIKGSTASADAAEVSLDENDADYQDSTNHPDEGKGLEVQEQFELYGHEGQEHEEYQTGLAVEETCVSEVNDEVHPIDFASVQDEGASKEPDSAPATQDDSVDALHDDLDHQSNSQSESTVENALREESTTQEQAPEPEDDLLGIAEDLFEGPTDDAEDDLAHIESVYSEQDFEDNDPDAPAGIDSTADDDLADDGNGEYDEDSYNVLEFSEHVELDEADLVHTDSQTHENPSKRSREEEDEWDFEETSTPEVKRRRPS